MNPLTLFGGGLSAGGGGPSSAESGDASAGLTNSFQYNAGFTVGGSGKTSSSQESAQTPSQNSGGNNMLIYVSIGLAALTLVIALVKK